MPLSRCYETALWFELDARARGASVDSFFLKCQWHFQRAGSPCSVELAEQRHRKVIGWKVPSISICPFVHSAVHKASASATFVAARGSHLRRCVVSRQALLMNSFVRVLCSVKISDKVCRTLKQVRNPCTDTFLGIPSLRFISFVSIHFVSFHLISSCIAYTNG